MLIKFRYLRYVTIFDQHDVGIFVSVHNAVMDEDSPSVVICFWHCMGVGHHDRVAFVTDIGVLKVIYCE
jgi:hypothetical protein